jgi:uncharacterized protein YndB with AHSA1/START domain/catechol 2,3-dioxygenase-like lactoylglutathione lyase family enzyme
MTEAAIAHEIAITRVYDAPRELVWKAWTEPDHLAQWWGARGWTTPASKITIDLRPGGSFRATSVSDEDGSEMTVLGVYRELVEPERLVLEEASEDSWHEGAVSVVTLTDVGEGRTEMAFHATIHTSDEMRAPAEAGIKGSFDRLAEHLGASMDLLLEVVQVPVSDVDLAKAFYTEKLGFDVDHDSRIGEEIRIVQLTPPGSGCSIVIGTGLADMEPGSLRGLQLVVADIRATRTRLAERGLDIGEVQVYDGGSPRPYREGDALDNVGFAFFSDPDGNGWALQQIGARGRA